jgi:cardiolipin synthase
MNFLVTPLVAAFFAFEWFLRVVMLFVVPNRRRPSSANAWLLLIMITPTIGTILFYMFADPKLPKSRRLRRRNVDELTRSELSELRADNAKIFANLEDSQHSHMMRLASVLGGMPAMKGSDVEIMTDYNSLFSRLIKDIDSAKEYVHIEFFIVVLDETTEPLFKALKKAVERGVTVRLLYDRVVSRHYPNHKKLVQMLEESGIDFQEMLPLQLMPGKNYTRPDLRNHRKIVVVDGVNAYTGSQNLVDRTYHRKDDIVYEEVSMRMTGPVVWQFNTIFRADWYAETNQPLLDIVEDTDMPKQTGDTVAQVLPSGPTHDHDNNLQFYTNMIYEAQERVSIVVPYFIPDESFLDAIVAATQRGVKVTMINSEAIDKILAGHAQRSYYEELLEAGVRIYLYEKPAFLHTKQVLIDDDVAIVGSSNLDIRSFELDLEITTIFYDKKVVKQLDDIDRRYRARSTRITLADWQTRPTRLRVLDNVARLTAPFQ